MNMVICVLLTTFAIVRMLGSMKPAWEQKKKKKEGKKKQENREKRISF